MKDITDNDLTLLFYGEHDDPALAATVAQSPELTARFEALSAELGRIDNLTPPERSADYGSNVWQRLSPLLSEAPERPAGRWNDWLSAALQPRFSWAGALSLVLVASLVFMLGRQDGQPGVSSPATGTSATATAMTGLNTERLLTSSVSGHLEQLNLAFTEFVNSSNPTIPDAGRLTDMLVANRLYRQAAIARGDQKLAAFLSELEPVLIELAHGANEGSADSNARIQQEIKDSLLFRIRVMNNQLEYPTLST